MKSSGILIVGILLFSLSSCIDNVFNIKQVYPIRDLSQVKQLNLYDYQSKHFKKIKDQEKIKWYSHFLKDSTNYFRSESINKEPVANAKFRLAFVTEGDTLRLTLYPTESPNKIVATFWDPYDPNDKLKFRRFNRFYLNDKIVDSLKSDLK